jgi:hypothetical protein
LGAAIQGLRASRLPLATFFSRSAARLPARAAKTLAARAAKKRRRRAANTFAQLLSTCQRCAAS